jgi:hypothetical protein
MLPLSDTPEQELRGFVLTWMKLLAQGRLEEACRLLDEPDSYGLAWTPERIVGAVENAFGEGSDFRNEHPEGMVFTDPEELQAQLDHRVGTLAGGAGYWLDCTVPLNHQSSDLTAQFEFLRRPHGIAVALQDLHVL